MVRPIATSCQADGACLAQKKSPAGAGPIRKIMSLTVRDVRMSVIVPISSALPLKADVAAVGRESPVLTQLGHSRGFESNGCLRPETVIGRGLTECPHVDQKAVIRVNCCGAKQSLRTLCRL